jgi:hypothetical protein
VHENWTDGVLLARPHRKKPFSILILEPELDNLMLAQRSNAGQIDALEIDQAAWNRR